MRYFVFLMLFICSIAQAPTQTSPVIPDILRAIALVESNNGKNVNHKMTSQGTAFGVYGLMPKTIQYIVKKTPKLHKYRRVATLPIGKVKTFMLAHPMLEHYVALALYKQLVRKFGKDPARIGIAWFMGATGASQMTSSEILSHWHTVKILKAYNTLHNPLKLKDNGKTLILSFRGTANEI